MASKEELDRLASALHSLRPDWPLRSVLTYLARTHGTRPYADLAIAATAVAVDSRTQTPKRLEESGPWWKAAQAAFGAGSPVVGPGKDRCAVNGHESYPAHTCPGCRVEALTGNGWPTGTHHHEAPKETW